MDHGRDDGGVCQAVRDGLAHSVEAWEEDRLVGGLYGVALGRMFFGESMFSRAPDASKVALVTLVKQIERWGFTCIDCQMSDEPSVVAWRSRDSAKRIPAADQAADAAGGRALAMDVGC